MTSAATPACIGEPTRHPCAGGAPLACVPPRAPASSHVAATPGRWHRGPHHGLAPNAAGGTGVPGGTHGADHHAHQATGAVDRAQGGSRGTLYVPSLVLDTKVPGPPTQGAPFHGPPPSACAAVGVKPLALQTHLEDHFGDNAILHPHEPPPAAPRYLQLTVPGIWFHELLSLATIRGAIVATDAGATLAWKVMVLAYESAPGEYITKVASGVGTSQDGEAMTLLLCVRQLAFSGSARIRVHCGHPTHVPLRGWHTSPVCAHLGGGPPHPMGCETFLSHPRTAYRPSTCEWTPPPGRSRRRTASWPRPICRNGFTNRRPSPLRCSMSTGGHPNTSEAWAYRWTSSLVTSRGTWQPIGCATSPP